MPIVTYGNRRLDAGEPGDKSRLDAGEAFSFLRDLESIDTEVYQKKYPDLMARRIIPADTGVDPDAHVRTWRMYDHFGIAQVIANGNDDMGEAEVSGEEQSQRIVPVGLGYGYNIFELQAARRQQQSIDGARAFAARDASERAVDLMLAQGKIQRPNGTPTTVPGITGLYSVANTTTFTPATKALGGTTWGTLSAPNASGDEVAADLMGIASKIFTTTNQLWGRVKIVLPPDLYEYASQKRLGSVSDTTALKYALANSNHIESIEPWWQATAGVMIAFPNDKNVVAAICNQEWTSFAPQLRGLRYFIPAFMKCGGVISRYPVAIGKATGL